MMNQNYDDTRTKVLIENTAQGVFKHLNEMKSSGRNTRWVWELLQNARDVSTGANNHLIAEVRYSGEKLIFLHNGRGFTVDEIAHLIFYGSTKVEDERAIGQYGSGFLTTHLLSWEIDVSGQLDGNKWFNFHLSRKPESVKALQESMDQAWEEFKNSVDESRPESLPDSFTTQFVYPIKNPEAERAVTEGIETLKQCAPYVVISNPQFSRINIDFPSEKMCFEANRHKSDSSSVQQITVTENINGNSRDKRYLQVRDDENTSVTVPLESKDGSLVCQSVEKIPRLFLGFPLVGTEAFSFPAIINSFKFTPTENRNGVYLGKNDDQENNTNQAVIEEACTLLTRLLQHAALAGWHHTHRWVEVPTIQGNDWVDAEWLKNCVKNMLMAAIYETPVVLNETGNAISMRKAMLPVAESNEGVEALWDLLEAWKEYPEKLPRRVEATGWCETIKNWASILGEGTSAFPAGIDGNQLASQMVEETKNSEGWGHLKNLQEMLRADVSGVEWLNQLYEFLRDNEFSHVIRVFDFIPDQEGWFHPLSKLYRDQGIDDVLKEVAQLLEWRIRLELRNLGVPSLDDEDGPGYKRSDEVINILLGKISNRANENPDAAFKEASVRLFGWIVSQEEFPRLLNFPVFAVDGKSVLELSSADNRTPPLAPVRSWHKDLQPFADLFPPERILDDAFFQKVPDQEVWKHLNDLDIVRTDMIISRETTNLNALSLELQGVNEGHEAAVPVGVTDFLEREAIMERVRNSPKRGRLFWQFLTEYLIKTGHQSLETQTIECKSCESTHNCYPAAWLESVRNNQWIILGRNSRFAPDAKSLANLLRDSDWKLSTMDENHALVEFLKAIRLTPSELRLEFIMNDEERDTVIQKMAEVHQAVGGNWEPIEALAKRMQNDEKASENIVRILEAPEDELNQVIDDLAERQKQQQRVTENQDLGLRVEKWVGEILEDEGFEVESVHTGADFIIESDLITLGVTRGTQEWWIEVKSARTESVKISSKQTQNALDKNENFLLCVVPIPEKTDLNFETVRKNMRFIKNISKKFGDRVTELCEYIGGQETVLTNDPDDTSPGVELEGEAGKAEIRVQKSVWESDEAFPLENLTEELR